MILIDNFLNDELLKDLNDIDIYKSNAGIYSWYDKKEPSNPIETFIEYAAKWLNIWDNAEGFEYWTTFSSNNSHVDWHIDCDEAYKESIPQNSTIFYGYPHEFLGGMLEFDYDGTASIVERFAPLYNRLVFNPEPEKKHRVTRVFNGERVSLIFSGWKEKPKLFKEINKANQEYVLSILNGDKE